MEEEHLKVLYDRILVKPLPPDTAVGGIELPDAAQKPKCQGIVMATGHGRLTKKGILVPLIVQVGDKVLYGEHIIERKLKVGDEEYDYMAEGDIYGILED